MDKSSAMILGARGSVPISSSDFASYGGATTCILVRLGGQYIVLDAGTGILQLPPQVLAQPQLTLLLTHAHLDHLNGLSMCPYVMKRGNVLDIYANLSDGSDIGAVLRKLYSPPVWPVLPEQLPAELRYHILPDQMELGDITVTTIDGIHPGGVKLIRLQCGGKAVVFATDCTLSDELYTQVVDFAKDCDLLLCDGQYSAAEWTARSGYGHNTWHRAAQLGRDCGAGQICIIHHDPTHTDDILDAASKEVRTIHPACRFAHEGEVIAL